jgi:hypothetical protein
MNDQLALASAIMISDAAALNAAVIHRDGPIADAFDKLTEMEESIVALRAALEEERERYKSVKSTSG